MDNYPFGSGGSSEPQATDDNKIGSSHSVSTQAAGNLGASFVFRFRLCLDVDAQGATGLAGKREVASRCEAKRQ